MTKHERQRDVNLLMDLSMMEFVVGGSSLEECAANKSCKESCLHGCKETCAATRRDGTTLPPPTLPPTEPPTYPPVL